MTWSLIARDTDGRVGLIAASIFFACGGDKRGYQAAGLVINPGEALAWLDIGADDHSYPLGEVSRLWDVTQERYVHFAEAMPTKAQFFGTPTRDGIDAEIAAAEAGRKAMDQISQSKAVDHG